MDKLKIRYSFIKLRIRRYVEGYSAHRLYANSLKVLSEDFTGRGLTSESRKYAVVVHLYYPEMWQGIKEYVSRLNGMVDYDIFITLPLNDGKVRSRMKSESVNGKKLYILDSANHGRDVCPFVYIANFLYSSGYRYVLKLHTKKSPHREDGSEWFENLLESLLPDRKDLLKEITDCISDDDVAVIGPADHYYPLTINFPANGMDMTRIMKDIFDRETSYKVLQLDRGSYGFFAGTMFWVDLEYINGLLGYKSTDFDSEKGQVDGTFAHALERMFCVVPEVAGRKIYESSSRDLRERAYSSSNIPEWSEHHNE